jgi:uncharacterized protein YndB with AHSA1/START domain
VVGKQVEVSQSVSAPPGLVWQACATPDGIQNWQADEVEGTIAPGARIRLRWPALRASMELEVLELEAGRRLVLRAGVSRVSVVLEPDRVRLTQDGLSGADECEGAASSWKAALALLAHHLEFHPHGRRRVEWYVQSAATSATAAHVFFTEPAALQTWLAQQATAIVPTATVHLQLAWGEQLTGRVLAHTPGRDVALSWPEQHDSALVLRTLPSPFDARQRLVAVVWSRWGNHPAPTATREGLAAAVRRLARALAQGGNA